MPPLAIIAVLVVGSIATVNIAIGFWAFVLTPRQLRREQQEREARERALAEGCPDTFPQEWADRTMR
jgi:hypothetical protein